MFYVFRVPSNGVGLLFGPYRVASLTGGPWRRVVDGATRSWRQAHVGASDRDGAQAALERDGVRPDPCRRRGRARIDRFPRARYDLELHYQALPNRVKCRIRLRNCPPKCHPFQRACGIVSLHLLSRFLRRNVMRNPYAVTTGSERHNPFVSRSCISTTAAGSANVLQRLTSPQRLLLVNKARAEFSATLPHCIHLVTPFSSFSFSSTRQIYQLCGSSKY